MQEEVFCVLIKWQKEVVVLSKLGKLLGIGSDDERFIEGLLDDLDTLGINYPDMSGVEFLDTNEIIYIQ